MATREENLKKINEELEKLDDEQLEKVAGGTWAQTAGDTRFLKDLAGLCDRFGKTAGFFKFGTVADEACKGWNKIGIQVNPGWYSGNAYYLDGQRITRRQAFEYALKKFDKKFQDMPEGKYGYSF